MKIVESDSFTASDISALHVATLDSICEDLELALAVAEGSSLVQEVLSLLTKAREVAVEGHAIANLVMEEQQLLLEGAATDEQAAIEDDSDTDEEETDTEDDDKTGTADDTDTDDEGEIRMAVFLEDIICIMKDIDIRFRFDRDWKKIEAYVGSKIVIQSNSRAHDFVPRFMQMLPGPQEFGFGPFFFWIQLATHSTSSTRSLTLVAAVALPASSPSFCQRRPERREIPQRRGYETPPTTYPLLVCSAPLPRVGVPGQQIWLSGAEGRPAVLEGRGGARRAQPTALSWDTYRHIADLSHGKLQNNGVKMKMMVQLEVVQYGRHEASVSAF
uniref:Uncharacterized protein n=1 Tax=Leersia perrieri TaxID=77586 RepID=A0A0D9XSL7_9ORYZ